MRFPSGRKRVKKKTCCWKKTVNKRNSKVITVVQHGTMMGALYVTPIRFRLNVIEIRALWGPNHHFKDSLIFFTLKIVLNDIGFMFGVIALLHNKFGSNHIPSWWYGMMDGYLPIFLSIEDTIDPDQISNSICRTAAPTCKDCHHASLLPADTHYCTYMCLFNLSCFML